MTAALAAPPTVLPPTPEEIDASIEQYDEAKRHFEAAKIFLDEEKKRLVFLVDSFGVAPDKATQSKRLEGRLHTATVTGGTTITVDEPATVVLYFFLQNLGRSLIFDKLFAAMTKHKLVEGAQEYLRTVDLPRRSHQKLLSLFGQCFTVDSKALSLTTKRRESDKPVRKLRAGKAGA